MSQNVPDAPGCVTTIEGAERVETGGFVVAEVIRDGPRGPEVLARRITHNLVVNTGKRQLWRIASGLNSTKVFDQGRIGTSGASPNSGHTNVLSPVTGTLNTVDSVTLLSGTRTARWIWSYPSGAGSKSAAGIDEAAILNENTSPGGSALMRSTFTAVNKTTADKLKLSYFSRVT